MARYDLVISYECEKELVAKQEKFTRLASQGTSPAIQELLRKDGIYLVDNELAQTGKLVFLFAGQSSAYTGMFPTLSKSHKSFQIRLGQANDFCKSKAKLTLSEVICNAQHESLLSDVFYSQLIPFTFQAAIVDELRELGIRPDISVGHSVGEFGALYSAGAVEFEEGLMALWARYQAVYELAGEVPPARMAAVRASLATTQELIAQIDGAYIANSNAPDQTVISFYQGRLLELREIFVSRGIDFKELAIANGFHSPIMDNAVPKFLEGLRKLNFKVPRIPVTIDRE